MIQLQRRSKRNLLLGFGFSLLILIFSSVASYLTIRKLLESQQLVAHTNMVETAFNNLISKMKDAETGQRGYLLSADETFLEPYTNAKTEIFDEFDKVQLLTVDNPIQQKDCPVLQRLIEKKLYYIDKSIKEKKLGIPPTMPALIAGKKVMDSVRTMVSQMIGRENKLLAARSKEMNTFAVATPIMIGIAAVISMAITIFFYYRVSRDAQVAVDLQNELTEKERKTASQITVIEEVAKKIAAGDYQTRVQQSDLE